MLRDEQKQLAWGEEKKETMGEIPKINREKMLNDLVNTGVMAALIGGFALSNLQKDYDVHNGWDVSIYMTSLIAIHLCTCSCLTSALLYRSANFLSDEEIPTWAAGHKMLLHFPIGKFVVGVISYIVSVMLTGWKELEGIDTFRIIALGIGLGSVGMIMFTAIWLVIKPICCKRNMAVNPKN